MFWVFLPEKSYIISIIRMQESLDEPFLNVGYTMRPKSSVHTPYREGVSDGPVMRVSFSDGPLFLELASKTIRTGVITLSLWMTGLCGR